MQISIINDCCDQNAKLRQISKAGSLFENASVNSFAAVSELEASGFLVDALDSFEKRPGVILVNVAPRNGSARKWKNGTPFGYFWCGKTLVVSSVDGKVLSLAKKMNLIDKFYIFDIEEVMGAINEDELSKEEKNRVINTQFRSLNFLPRAAYWVWKEYDLPKKEYNLGDIQDVFGAVWFIDNFGNIKTSLVRQDMDLKNGEKYSVDLNGKNITATFYEKLRDLPDGEIGIIEGSSGIEDKRFLEINLQGGSAAKKLDAKIGGSIKI